MTPNDFLISLCQAAYSIELSTINSLESRIVQAKDSSLVDSETVTVLQRHMDLSRAHARTVSEIIKRFGGSTVALAPAIISEENSAINPLLKGFISDYAAEHLEMAIYNSIIAVAEEIGLSEVSEPFKSILQEEVDMASYLNDSLPGLMREFTRNLGK